MPNFIQRAILLSSTNHITDFAPTALGVGSNSTPGNLSGLLGAIFPVSTDKGAQKYTTNNTTFPVYAGSWQIVKVAVSLTVTFGQLLYWSDKPNMVVTNDGSSGKEFAGIAMVQTVTTTSTVQNYIYMAVPEQGNNATVLFVTSTTKSTPAAGDIVSTSATAGSADVLADATAFIGSNLRPIGKLNAAVNASHFGKVSFTLLG